LVDTQLANLRKETSHNDYKTGPDKTPGKSGRSTPITSMEWSLANLKDIEISLLRFSVNCRYLHTLDRDVKQEGNINKEQLRKFKQALDLAKGVMQKENPEIWQKIKYVR